MANVPTSDIDIWRSAKLLVDEHGDTAAIHAAMPHRQSINDRQRHRVHLPAILPNAAP